MMRVSRLWKGGVNCCARGEVGVSPRAHQAPTRAGRKLRVNRGIDPIH